MNFSENDLNQFVWKGFIRQLCHFTNNKRLHDKNRIKTGRQKTSR